MTRGQKPHPTVGKVPDHRPDRSIGTKANAPHQLWVADITYVARPADFCYTAFVTDAFSRKIAGWSTDHHAYRCAAIRSAEDALLSAKDPLEGLVHHSDRGSQHVSIRYTEHLARAGLTASVGTAGDAYDNAWLRQSTGYKDRVVL